MFNLQGSEIIVILLIALVILGPEKLPGAVRRFTKVYAELRKMGSSFQKEVKDAFDDPIREVRQTADLFKQQVDEDAIKVEPIQSDALDQAPQSKDVHQPIPGVDPDPAADMEAGSEEQLQKQSPTESARLATMTSSSTDLTESETPDVQPVPPVLAPPPSFSSTSASHATQEAASSDEQESAT